MQRRDFLRSTAAAALTTGLLPRALAARPELSEGCDCTTYASPEEARKAPRETLMYVPGLYGGTKVNKPDFLATVDLDPSSTTYSQVVHRLPMPTPGDELHHFGWNACSS